MPHSSDFGWTERKHESNGGENGGRRGRGRWARGQLSPAAGPPGACTARGGPQDACSDQGEDRVGLPRTWAARVEPGACGASPATGCPPADQAPPPDGDPDCAADPCLSARCTPQAASPDPAADGRTAPRRVRAAAPGRPQPQATRRRVTVSEPRPRARMSACPFAAPVRSASRSPRSRSGGACHPSSGGSSWTRPGSRRRAPLPRRLRTGAAARRGVSARMSNRYGLRPRRGRL